MVNTIIQFADYSDLCQGMFISSFVELDKALKKVNPGIRIVYVFPERAKDTLWYKDFSANHEVRAIGDHNLTQNIFSIISEVKPDLVHSHHDTYDVPICMSCRKYKRIHANSPYVVWHLHNEKGHSQKTVLSKTKWFVKFLYKYGIVGKGIDMIFVNDYMRRFVRRYDRYNIFCKTQDRLRVVLPNGVLESMISSRPEYQRHTPYTFLTYGGGYNNQKDTWTILKAGKILSESGEDFKILITLGHGTKDVVSTVFGNQIPSWLTLTQKSNDVNDLLEQADCFVSTSIHETFSWAVCEATFHGIPVIQSDIEGTDWNSGNPSTILFHVGDEHDLAERMGSVLMMDKDDLWSKCVETRRRNREQYSMSRWCERIVNCYNEITDK